MCVWERGKRGEVGGLFALLFVSLSSCISIVTVSCGCVAYKPSDWWVKWGDLPALSCQRGMDCQCQHSLWCHLALGWSCDLTNHSILSFLPHHWYANPRASFSAFWSLLAPCVQYLRIPFCLRPRSLWSYIQADDQIIVSASFVNWFWFSHTKVTHSLYYYKE